MRGIVRIKWEELFGLVEPLVSVLVFWRSIDICRSWFQPSTSTPGPNDPIGTLWVIPTWLCDWITSQVGRFTILRWADDFVVYSLDLERSASMDGSNDPVGVLRGDFGWPHGVCAL